MSTGEQGVENMNGSTAVATNGPGADPQPRVPHPVQPAPIPSSSQPQVAQMVYTNPQVPSMTPDVPAPQQALGSAAPQPQQNSMGSTEVSMIEVSAESGSAGPQGGVSPEETGDKCRGAPGLDSDPVVVEWDVVRKVVFKMEDKAKNEQAGAIKSATLSPGTAAPAAAGAVANMGQSFRQSEGMSGVASGTRSPVRVLDNPLLQGFDIKRDTITVVINQEEEQQHSKMMQFLHHMRDVDLTLKKEPSKSKLTRSDSVSSTKSGGGEPPAKIPDDEELDIQQSVLHLKKGFVKSDQPESLWENFEIVSTHLVVHEGESGTQDKTDCKGFAGAGHVLQRMNMAFAGGKFVSKPVAVSGDYRFGALVSGKSILVKMLTGGTVLCNFKLEGDEEVTMLNFSPTGDILIGVMRKANTSYLKVWSVITSDTLKVLDDIAIFPTGCMALASISSDKTQIFVLVATNTGSFRLAVYSLSATSPVKKLDVGVKPSSKDKAAEPPVTAEAQTVKLPFNPFQFFMFECSEQEVELERNNKKVKKNVWQWKSMLRHRVCNTKQQELSRKAADKLLEKMQKDKLQGSGMGMISSDANKGVFCQVFQKYQSHGVHNFDELDRNTNPEELKRNENDERPQDPVRAPSEQTNVITLVEKKKATTSYAACVPDDTTVVLWDDAGELCHLWSHNRKVTCIDVSADGAVVVVGVSGKEEAAGGNKNIEMARVIIYSLITLEEIYSYALPQDVSVAKLDFQSSNRRLVVQYDTPASEGPKWIQLRMDEMEQIESLSGKKDKSSPPTTVYPDQIAITNDGFFFFSMSTVGKASEKMQKLTLGAVGFDTTREFYMVPTHHMCKFTAEERPGPKAREVKVWCVCISGWGNSIGVGLTHKVQGEKKRHYVVVMSASSLHVLMVALVDSEPRAMCIEQEQVTVIGDNAQPASFAEKESQIITFSAITGNESGKGRNKVVGRTLGLTAGGSQRVGQHEDGRIFIEQIDSGETIFQIQDRTLRFKGVSAAGKLLALVRPHEPENAYPGLYLKDINNMDRFGPALDTCMLWFQAFGGPDVTAADIQVTLSRYKSGLPKWPLLFLDDWSKIFTELFEVSLRDRDYGPFKVLIESCPHFWAGTRYLDEKEKVEAEGKKKGMLGIDMPPGVPLPMPIKAPGLPIPGLKGKKKEDDGQTKEKEFEADPKTFWSKALENNDKIFVQMLLDGVLEMVGSGENVPVRDMEQVTEFIVNSIAASKMQEKVEAFLMELPLLHVPNTFHNGRIEEVSSLFPGGDVVKTAWSTRSAPLSATAFSYMVDESKGQGERGYRYVSALPGLTKMETLEAFTSADASAALVDNETLRSTIDALEETTSDSFLGMAWDWTLFPFIITLICFCLMVFLCVTADASFAQLMEGRKEQFGLAMGGFAVVGHIVFLYFEFIEFKTQTGAWWTKTAGYFMGGFWNILPFLGNIMGIVTFLLLVNDGSKVQIRSVAAFSMIFLWFNLFNYLRAYRKGSALVKMLIEIMADMGYFVGVVLVLLLSFAGGFYALHGRLNPEELGIEPDICQSEPSENTFEDLSDAFANTFLIAILGAFEVDQFRSPLDLAKDESGVLTNISFFFFFLLVILVSVVALNALIAIMGSTYGRVEEAQQAVTYKEIASIMYDKLRFRHFHLHGAKENFERDNRWTHVLSPSESGSMPQARAISKGGQNPVVTLKKDIRDNQNRTETELNKLQEMLRAQEESMHEMDHNVDAEALNEAVEQIGSLPNEVKAIKHEVQDIQQQVDPSNQQEVPLWARELMAAVRGGGGGLGGRGGDGIQTLRELNDLKMQVISLKQGLEEQWSSYNDMRVRLDAHGLQGSRSQTTATPRNPGAGTRSMRAAAHASSTLHPTASSPGQGGGDAQGGNQV